MPFYTRSVSPTYSTVIRTGAPEVKTVVFPDAPVTAVSRPLSSEESWALYNFEMHARECDACYSPYEVQKSHGRLCYSGEQLAADVAQYVVSRNDGTQAYSAIDKLVRVELPPNHDRVRSLLRAAERGLLSRSGLGPQVMTVTRSQPVLKRRPQQAVHIATVARHRPRVQAPEVRHVAVREPHQVIVESQSQRQSVYPTYTTEIRSPSRRSRNSQYYV